MAKTVVIWDTFGEDDVAFYVCEGNLTGLNHVYVNSTDHSQDKQDLIQQAISEGTKLTEFPLEMVRDPDEEVEAVITAGFLP